MRRAVAISPSFLASFVIALCLQIGACGSLPWVGNAGPESPNTAQLRSTILHNARKMLGAPYRYGGASPQGFDCSGLVFYSYRQARIQVPRTSLAQYRQSKPVPSRQLRPGDLVFFRLKGRVVSHVGIYQGRDKFVHASTLGKRVSIQSLANPYWRKRLVRGGRFL